MIAGLENMILGTSHIACNSRGIVTKSVQVIS